MTTIGILGAGRVGTNLADKLAAAGHHVILGQRGPVKETEVTAQGAVPGSPSPISAPPPGPGTS